MRGRLSRLAPEAAGIAGLAVLALAFARLGDSDLFLIPRRLRRYLASHGCGHLRRRAARAADLPPHGIDAAPLVGPVFLRHLPLALVHLHANAPGR